jgi:hypothetical protein
MRRKDSEAPNASDGRRASSNAQRTLTARGASDSASATAGATARSPRSSDGPNACSREQLSRPYSAVGTRTARLVRVQLTRRTTSRTVARRHGKQLSHLKSPEQRANNCDAGVSDESMVIETTGRRVSPRHGVPSARHHITTASIALAGGQERSQLACGRRMGVRSMRYRVVSYRPCRVIPRW